MSYIVLFILTYTHRDVAKRKEEESARGKLFHLTIFFFPIKEVFFSEKNVKTF